MNRTYFNLIITRQFHGVLAPSEKWRWRWRFATDHQASHMNRGPLRWQSRTKLFASDISLYTPQWRSCVRAFFHPLHLDRCLVCSKGWAAYVPPNRVSGGRIRRELTRMTLMARYGWFGLIIRRFVAANDRCPICPSFATPTVRLIKADHAGSRAGGAHARLKRDLIMVCVECAALRRPLSCVATKTTICVSSLPSSILHSNVPITI